jgi:sulfur-oxidizing protein SoxY
MAVAGLAGTPAHADDAQKAFPARAYDAQKGMPPRGDRAQEDPPARGDDAQKATAALAAKDVESALRALGVQKPGPGKRILLDVPEIIDEKASLVIKVNSAIPNSDWIAILIDKNAPPFVGQYDLAAKVTSIAVKAKLTQTSTITAIVRADGKYYRVDKEVKVAVAGACE